MTDRYAALERLEARARREAAAAALRQFEPFRDFAADLARAALRSRDDRQFLQFLLDRELERRPARLLREADPAPIAAALERAMSAALLSGATARTSIPKRLRREK